MNACKHHSRLRRNCRGEATVEFAFCAPVLFLTLFALIEFSRANQLRQTVIQAAYEGARTGITPGATAAAARAKAQSILNAVGVRSSTITITPSTITSTTPTVSVTVALDPFASGWLNMFFRAGSNMSSTVTLDTENQAISYVGS